MAKVVKIKGELLGLPDKEWNLIDSNANMKKFIKNFTNWNEKILEIDDNPLVMTQFIVEEIPNMLEDMLNLTKVERKKMDEASFSDQYDLFRKMAREFLGFKLAPLSEGEKPEDPKKLEEEWTSNLGNWAMILII